MSGYIYTLWRQAQHHAVEIVIVMSGSMLWCQARHCDARLDIMMPASTWWCRPRYYDVRLDIMMPDSILRCQARCYDAKLVIMMLGSIWWFQTRYYDDSVWITCGLRVGEGWGEWRVTECRGRVPHSRVKVVSRASPNRVRYRSGRMGERRVMVVGSADKAQYMYNCD